MQTVKVIGAGLAGCECAYYLAKNGIKVELYDIKPTKFSPAHKNQNFAELVCSNSLKSNDVYGNAAGLLKEEMRLLGSLIIESADKHAVPAGNALAVNREEFAKYITDKIKTQENITFISIFLHKKPPNNRFTYPVQKAKDAKNVLEDPKTYYQQQWDAKTAPQQKHSSR